MPPQRLVVGHPRYLGWALRNARASDVILLSALVTQNGDAIDLSEKTGRPIYILEERVKQRLGLTVAPVIVEQSGTRLVLTEYGPTSRASAAPAKGATRCSGALLSSSPAWSSRLSCPSSSDERRVGTECVSTC